MQRYSLYIDHQLVSGLIRQLETIVRTCHEQLDEQYETYELRTSIYEEFVFQIIATFNAKYELKEEGNELKDEQLKKLYQLSAKLEGTNYTAKLEDMHVYPSQIKKGRPTKYQQAEKQLVQWIKNKVQTEGILIFQKKQIDNLYLPLTNQEKKKVIPLNTYLKIFKKFQLDDIAIIARGGKQKTTKDLNQKKNFQNSFWKKEQDQSTLKYQYVQGSDLQSTSEIQSQLQSDFQFSKEARMITKTSTFDDYGINPKKKKLRSNENQLKKESKVNKRKLKKKPFINFFEENSDQEGDYDRWNNNLSISNDAIDEVNNNAEIYENSKSFE